MIYALTMYAAKCDNCKEGFGGFEHDDLVMPDISSMNNEIGYSSWLKELDAHYCPECWSCGENDEIIIDKTRFKE